MLDSADIVRDACLRKLRIGTRPAMPAPEAPSRRRGKAGRGRLGTTGSGSVGPGLASHGTAGQGFEEGGEFSSPRRLSHVAGAHRKADVPRPRNHLTAEAAPVYAFKAPCGKPSDFPRWRPLFKALKTKAAHLFDFGFPGRRLPKPRMKS